MSCKPGHICRAEYPGVRPWCPVCKKDMRKLSTEERLSHVTGHEVLSHGPDLNADAIDAYLADARVSK